MDLNLKWEASKWIMNNLGDMAFWLLIAKYSLDSILANVPAAKANTTFEAICNITDSMYSGIKSLMPGKSTTTKGE